MEKYKGNRSQCNLALPSVDPTNLPDTNEEGKQCIITSGLL
jgi:hypothetical protein